MAINGAVILVTPSNKTLILKKTYDRLGWTTPGGRIDPNETGFMAAVRELSEETDITLSLFDIESVEKFVYVNTEIYVMNILVEGVDINVTLSSEHSEYAWADINDLPLYSLENYTLNSFKQAITMGLITF